MLNKIKDKFIHILRENCGYYELEESEYDYREWYHECNNDFITLMKGYDKLSSKHEAKILEYDILFNNYKKLIAEVTNKTPINIEYKLEDAIKYYYIAKEKDYKKYLVAELEEILKIMKEKGIHPQDLIKRIINKANRDLKE